MFQFLKMALGLNVLVFSMLLCSCSDGDSSDDSGDSLDSDTVTGDSTDNGSTDNGSTDSQSEMDSASQAPILTDAHPGWLKQDCSQCHGDGNPDHFADYETWECAKCHGGNGAPTPPAAIHTFDSCTTACHDAGGKHGYTELNQCTWCHFSPAN